MSTSIIAAAMCALVVLLDAKPWHRPARTLTVTLKVDTEGFEQAMRDAMSAVHTYSASSVNFVVRQEPPT